MNYNNVLVYSVTKFFIRKTSQKKITLKNYYSKKFPFPHPHDNKIEPT